MVRARVGADRGGDPEVVGASIHVDDPAVETRCARGGADRSADTGDEDAAFASTGIDDHELLWFATRNSRICW